MFCSLLFLVMRLAVLRLGADSSSELQKEAESECNILSFQTILCHFIGRPCPHGIPNFPNPDVWIPVFPLESVGSVTLSRHLTCVSKVSCKTLSCPCLGTHERTEYWMHHYFLTHIQNLAMMNVSEGINRSWVGAQDLT